MIMTTTGKTGGKIEKKCFVKHEIKFRLKLITDMG